jgi:hypothetical protein
MVHCGTGPGGPRRASRAGSQCRCQPRQARCRRQVVSRQAVRLVCVRPRQPAAASRSGQARASRTQSLKQPGSHASRTASGALGARPGRALGSPGVALSRAGAKRAACGYAAAVAVSRYGSGSCGGGGGVTREARMPRIIGGAGYARYVHSMRRSVVCHVLCVVCQCHVSGVRLCVMCCVSRYAIMFKYVATIW